MKLTDNIVGYTRGSVDEVLDYFSDIEMLRREEFEEYVRLVFEYAEAAGVDPSIAIAQAAHETESFQSPWWVERLNPAGLGITGDKVQEEATPYFTPETAARAHIAHLKLYATGKIESPFVVEDDPRAVPYLSTYGEVAKATTLGELAGTWATDLTYADKIMEYGSAIFNFEEQVAYDETLSEPVVETTPEEVPAVDVVQEPVTDEVPSNPMIDMDYGSTWDVDNYGSDQAPVENVDVVEPVEVTPEPEVDPVPEVTPEPVIDPVIEPEVEPVVEETPEPVEPPKPDKEPKEPKGNNGKGKAKGKDKQIMDFLQEILDAVKGLTNK